MRTKHLLLFFTLSFASMILKAQIYLGKACEISFYSKGLLEDIYAINTSARPILNTATNEVAIKITIKGFVFKDKLMEEHFNEKYMESDKYPHAVLTGKINEKIEDYTKDSTYHVTITGILNMHGIKKDITIPAVATIKDSLIYFESKFPVLLKDYNIKIPSIVAQNIAEQVEVTVKGVLAAFKQ